MPTITTTTTHSTTNNYFSPARQAPRPSPPLYSSPTHQKRMFITQTYYLAHKARGKLSREASRSDHNLRLLVGHANLLDSLMLNISQPEHGQESWFNQSVRRASPSAPPAAQPTTQQEEKTEKHIQWADSAVKDIEEDWAAEEASDSSDSDYDDSDSYFSDSDEYDDDGDVEMADAVALCRVASHSSTYVYRKSQPTIGTEFQIQNTTNTATTTQDQSNSMIEDEQTVEFEDDDEEDYAQLTLTRSHSHTPSPPPPPELDEDEEDSDEDEDESSMMPPSPPTPTMHQFTEKEREAIATTGYYPPSHTQPPQKQQLPQIPSSNCDQRLYLPPRNPARLVTAISVY